MLDAMDRPGEARESWRQSLVLYEKLGHPEAVGVRNRLDRDTADQNGYGGNAESTTS
jgi:hypothetical protein